MLGIGHLKRAATLARALSAHGFEVLLVSGGAPLPGLALGGARLHQLPPVQAPDAAFRLTDLEGTPLGRRGREARTRSLLAAYRGWRPRLVVTEHFPFGRRALREELLALLGAARADGCVVAGSVRDILVPPADPARVDETLAWVREYFDRVLVHGDPDFVPFERTFPRAAELACPLNYTGYVVDRDGDRAGAPEVPGRSEVIVSAGSGAGGDRLLKVALAARPGSAARDRDWRVLVGYRVPDGRLRALARAAAPGVTVERARPDFPRLLRAAGLSISQAGYNTAMEVLDAGIPAVVVPYAAAGETEQSLRARELARTGLVHMIDERSLAVEVMVEAIDLALSGPPHRRFPLEVCLDTGGVRATVRRLREVLSAGPRE